MKLAIMQPYVFPYIGYFQLIKAVDKFVIQGGAPLEGAIAVSGSKNSALPAIAACLLTGQKVTLHRIPRVKDIRTMLDLVRHTGLHHTHHHG